MGTFIGRLGLMCIALILALPVEAGSRSKITPGVESVKVKHGGRMVTVRRSDDPHGRIPQEYTRTYRSCPPFCLQPMQIMPGVTTVGELEVLEYLQRISQGDQSIMVIDSRTSEWTRRGTIPGSVNISWDKINIDVAGTYEIETEARTLNDILSKQFGARLVNGKWDFSRARTLVLFCNGIWCPQSSINIKTLSKLGYPVSKLKWYRGGMQAWVSAGLTTVQP